MNKFELLNQAVENNNLEDMRSLLSEGTDFIANSSGAECLNLIIKPSQKGNLETLKCLVSHGIHNQIAKHEFNSLARFKAVKFLSQAAAYAMEEGHAEVVKYLIEQGVDVLYRHSGNTNFLRLAAFRNDFEMVKYLITQGAGLYDGLSIARRRDKKNDLVEKLKETNSLEVLEYLKDVEVFSRAAQAGDLEKIKSSLAKGIGPNVRITYLETDTSPKATPLCEAARLGHKEVVKYLVENGADVNYRFSTGYQLYPLNVAAENGHFEIVKYLVQNGADVHTKSVSSNYDCLSRCTPLDLAAVNGHLEIVKYLHEELAADLNFDHPIDNIRKKGIVHVLAQRGYVNVMQYLLDKGLNLDFKNADGDTPLILAVWSKQLEMVKFLIDQKVDISVKGTSNRNILDIALRGHESIDIVLEIIDHPEYFERLIDDEEFLDYGIGDHNYRASKAILLLLILDKSIHYGANEHLINKIHNKYHQEIKGLDKTIKECEKEFS